MAEAAVRQATYADLERVPDHLVGEILFGVLETYPRPVPRHALAMASLTEEVSGRFQKGRGGPGGWHFMTEPEIHLGAHVVVPDIAGWRRERLVALPETPYMTQAPDWVCEILSPSTEQLDRGAKRRIYAEAGVGFLWLLDPRTKILETFALSDRRWALTGTFDASQEVSAPPFEVASFPLAALFPLDPPDTSA